MDHNNFLAVVLAGGKSKRFGRDKSQVKLGDKILINYILSEIIDIYNDILIVANEPIKFLESDKISLTSDYKKDLGPLGGVFSAMKWVKDNNKKYRWIASFPSDTPFFNIDIFKSFLQKINEKESELFFMKTKEKRHNIFGLWSLELINILEEDIKKNFRKVETWANKIGLELIEIDAKQDDTFLNINTKDDLEKAENKLKVIK